jgi:uncharacterized protein (TIGR03437 family)
MRSLTKVSALPAVLCFGLTASAQVSVLTSNYNNERNNWNPQESVLTPASVNPSNFGKIGSFPVDGQIYAQPLYVSGLQIPGAGTRDVVYIATMHNSVYAIDAGAPQSTTPLWTVNLGPSLPSSEIPNFTDIVPEIGILGTPVIDLGRGAIYVVAETFENKTPVFRIHALSLADGHEMFSGPTVITANVRGTGDGGDTVTFDPRQHLQRPGLALVNGVVYAGFGSHRDEYNWYGWLLGYAASDLRNQIAKWNATPNGSGGSIWQCGRAPAIDAAGILYLVTSNGDYDGQANLGESFVKLSTPGLSVLDWYTPNNVDELNLHDWDVGSSGAILIPNLNLVVGVGKSGELFAVNRNSMGHQSANSPTQRVQASNYPLFSMALWNSDQGPIVYLLDTSGPLYAFRFAGGQPQVSPFSATNPTVYTLFSGLAVSSNGAAAPTGIVWQTVGDTGTFGIPGSLHAFAATDLSDELWNSDMVPDRDRLGRFAKFVAPTVVNGRVYVPTFSNQLVVYGVLSGVNPGSGAPHIATVSNAASFASGAIAPGEIVTIFGIGLGPEEAANLKVDDSGHVEAQLANTQVFFDGVAAPMLYASSGQINAVVPFGVTGPSNQVRVQYQGTMSPAVSVPVVSSVPALFASDGTGGSQGAILNQDGTANGYYNPADRGSVVALYGTGGGQMVPPGEDGAIAGGLPLPAPILPVTVQIDGQDAEVSYAGQAPGLVEGVMQINAKIPDSVASGEVSVNLKVGGAASPATVTLMVR